MVLMEKYCSEMTEISLPQNRYFKVIYVLNVPGLLLSLQLRL